jgi:hypothetical protein
MLSSFSEQETRQCSDRANIPGTMPLSRAANRYRRWEGPRGVIARPETPRRPAVAHAHERFLASHSARRRRPRLSVCRPITSSATCDPTSRRSTAAAFASTFGAELEHWLERRGTACTGSGNRGTLGNPRGERVRWAWERLGKSALPCRARLLVVRPRDVGPRPSHVRLRYILRLTSVVLSDNRMRFLPHE